MIIMTSGFCCKCCLEILRSQSHWECEGCSKKIHFTCSGLSGDAFQYLKRARKQWRACVLCKVPPKLREKRCKYPKLTSYMSSDNREHSSMSNSQAFKLIDSVSDSLGKILDQLRDLKSVNSRIDDCIRKLAMSDDDKGNLPLQTNDTTLRKYNFRTNFVEKTLPTETVQTQKHVDIKPSDWYKLVFGCEESFQNCDSDRLLQNVNARNKKVRQYTCGRRYNVENVFNHRMDLNGSDYYICGNGLKMNQIGSRKNIHNCSGMLILILITKMLFLSFVSITCLVSSNRLYKVSRKHKVMPSIPYTVESCHLSYSYPSFHLTNFPSIKRKHFGE